MSVQMPSPTASPNCCRATLFHLVAAWTTWASTGCRSWSLAMWNVTGVRDPSRSSMSLTPDSASTMSGTWTIIRFSSRHSSVSM